MQEQTNLNRAFVIEEEKFDEHTIQLLRLVEMVTGYFRSETVYNYLSEMHPTEYEHSNSEIAGFFALMNHFSDNAVKMIDAFLNDHKILHDDKTENTITPEQLGLKRITSKNKGASVKFLGNEIKSA